MEYLDQRGAEQQAEHSWLFEEAEKMRSGDNEVQPIGLNKELEKTQKLFKK